MLRNRVVWFPALVVISTGALFLSAQQPNTQITPVIRVTTRLVMVDVIAVDKSGKPVSDLKPEDFLLEESGKKQKISIFGVQRPAVGPVASPVLPPNIYSNRSEAQLAPGAITILLVDGLNSPFQNQAFVRQKLIEYVKAQHQPGQRMAVLALGRGLFRLQGFTSDPGLLRAALESWRPESARETSTTPAEVRVTSAPPEPIGLRGATGAARLQAVTSVLNQFMLEQALAAYEVRVGVTLESLRAIGRMVGGMPGRKNLVWVSAAFPFTLTPEDAAVTYTPTRADDPTAPPPLPEENTQGAYLQQIRQGRVDEIRRTAALLADAQVAIYPVDARGLIGAQQLADASRSGLNAAGLLQMGHEYGTQVQNVGASITENQGVMNDLAQQTGGRAYYNRNDIDSAVALASTDGGTYYNLGYYPDKKKFDGSFRKIKVSVSRPGVELRHRRGFYAIDPTKIDAKQRDAEMNALMLRGSGDATLVTFDALVVPPAAPAAQAKVTVQFLVPATSFSAEDAGNGGRHINLDFFVAAVTPDGKVAANTGQTVDTTLTAEQFAQVQQLGLLLPIEATVPAGEYELRLAVRDNRTGYFGTLSAPLTLRRPGP